MRRQGILLLTLLLMSLFLLTAEASDWNYRTLSIIKWRFADRWAVKSTSQSNFRNDMRDHYFTWADIGFEYELYDWLNVGLAYRLVREKSTAGVWATERRPMVDFDFKTKISNVKVSNRCRFERQDYKSPLTKDVFRYRHATKLTPPISWTKLKITPYIENEIFYNFNTGYLEMNWLTTGVSWKLTKNLIADISYRFQNVNKPSGWESVNVLGTKMMLLF